MSSVAVVVDAVVVLAFDPYHQFLLQYIHVLDRVFLFKN
jgi:hypothetical protein